MNRSGQVIVAAVSHSNISVLAPSTRNVNFIHAQHILSAEKFHPTVLTRYLMDDRQPSHQSVSHAEYFRLRPPVKNHIGINNANNLASLLK
jgi:microsomal dipeptidase-like Zn-dependent dipeptidase